MKILKSFLFSLFSLYLATPVLAGKSDPVTGIASGEEPPKISGIGTIFDNIMEIVFPLAAIVCVVFIIIGGYMWIASAGDPSKVKQAQGTLTWAIIGLAFVLLSVLIIRTVVNAL